MTLIGANGAGKSSTLRALSAHPAGRRQGHLQRARTSSGIPVARAGWSPASHCVRKGGVFATAVGARNLLMGPCARRQEAQIQRG